MRGVINSRALLSPSCSTDAIMSFSSASMMPPLWLAWTRVMISSSVTRLTRLSLPKSREISRLKKSTAVVSGETTKKSKRIEGSASAMRFVAWLAPIASGSRSPMISVSPVPRTIVTTASSARAPAAPSAKGSNTRSTRITAMAKRVRM